MTLARKHYDPDAAGPLHGVRILDLSRLFAGNVLTQLLGDFGADVIKVEPPEGDTLRHWKVEDVATHWQVYGRNKRSLCLNLRDPRAIALLKKLVPTADILLESFRPGGHGPGPGQTSGPQPQTLYRPDFWLGTDRTLCGAAWFWHYH